MTDSDKDTIAILEARLEGARNLVAELKKEIEDQNDMLLEQRSTITMLRRRASFYANRINGIAESMKSQAVSMGEGDSE